eukprot:c17154_g1_i1.p1 GENE.c17154_g1_i1~~c17154_g1_i1.p1  ORF type:complete len:279 (-),score=101.48 c17154_g1_i1:42-854(-)
MSDSNYQEPLQPGIRFEKPLNHTPAIIVLIASLIELIAASKACGDADKCEKEVAYSVSVGCIAIFTIIPILILSKISPSVVELITPLVSGFLFLWWGIGACVLTFRSPFKTTQNGYFASWLASGASSYYFLTVVPHAREALDRVGNVATVTGPIRQLLFAVFVSSLIVMIASSIAYNDNSDDKKGEKIWGIIVGLFSLIISVVAAVVPLPKIVFQIISIFLGIWWTVGLGVLTFDSPFLNTGNGFFACWIGLASSVYLALIQLRELVSRP